MQYGKPLISLHQPNYRRVINYAILTIVQQLMYNGNK